MKITAKDAHEFLSAMQYSYLSDETAIKNMIDIFSNNEDVIMYGLVSDEIKSLSWRIKNDDDTINTESEIYPQYIKLCDIANKLGDKII